MKVFPTRRFHFDASEVGIELQEVSGGVALSGDEDVTQTDGGGRVFATFIGAFLDDPYVALDWSALGKTIKRDGFIAVPLGDARRQQMGEITTPPGGSPWWDESAFTESATGVTLDGVHALRATTLTLAIDYLPAPIRPGMWFSVDCPTWRFRAHHVDEVTAQDGVSATIKISPPLREALDDGAALNFIDPKCVMRIDGDMRMPTEAGFAAPGDVRFVEDMTGSYD